MSEPRLAIKPADLQAVLPNINHVIHCAASIELEAEVTSSLKHNYLGTEVRQAAGAQNIVLPASSTADQTDDSAVALVKHSSFLSQEPVSPAMCSSQFCVTMLHGMGALLQPCSRNCNLTPHLLIRCWPAGLLVQQLLQLAMDMPNLRVFVHTSSAYTNMHRPRGSSVAEQIYPLSLGGECTRPCAECAVHCHAEPCNV